VKWRWSSGFWQGIFASSGGLSEMLSISLFAEVAKDAFAINISPLCGDH